MRETDHIVSARKMLGEYLTSGKSFVAYRLPGDKQAYSFQVGKVQSFSVSEFTPEAFEDAFIIAPFKMSKSAFALWPVSGISRVEVESENFEREIREDKSFRLPQEREEIRQAYGQSFSVIREALNAHVVDKVVLARQLEVSEVPEHILPQVFSQLCRSYPNAFVYFFDHPLVGRWMGASPETFLEKENHQLKTVALAATRKSELHSEDWNMKELEEQGLVSVFVDEVLKKYGISTYQKNGPEPVRAGSMIHLKTSYEFEACKLEDAVGLFLQSLHPTPAVGGYPKDIAIRLIEEAEKFDRGFYSGFLGPVGKGDFRFFVNIRSMKLGENKAVLYLGGGITRDSKEANEWEETRLKARTLLSVLHSVKQNYSNESIHLR
ncbi:chorismate-binding protein [Marinilabilia salmonicolor]|uniref:chorismate-binding protein n=1 Tax=Marinilabilia salmonicolor TaxID=989 RepID=UPI001F2725B1|nr:chorismate-binding protein [Marinilabilia salmonicolor]